MRTADDDRLRDIGMRAASLDERLSCLGQAPADAEESSAREAERVVSMWRKACAEDDENAFRRRLIWDGLTEATAVNALATFSIERPPEWTSWIPEFLLEADRLSDQMERGQNVEPSLSELASKIPFFELCIPFARASKKRLIERCPHLSERLTRSAITDLQALLMKEVSLASELAVYEQYREYREAPAQDERAPQRDTSDDMETNGYQRFVLDALRGGLSVLFLSYPVLARQVSRLAETWVENSDELCRRIGNDRDLIADEFNDGVPLGPVTRVQSSFADRHRGGRRVACLTFESGLRLVYKPREVALERAVQGFLEWCRSLGLAVVPTSPHVIDRGDYGWVGFVEQAELETEAEVREYFRRAGSLLCLTHLLRARDLHMENVIASDEGPVVADAEMVCQPSRAGVDTLGEFESEGGPEESLLATGLLTFIQVAPDGSLYDIGGLRGRGGFSRPATRVWEGIGTEELRCDEKVTAAPDAENCVIFAGERRVPEEYPSEIMEGFTQTYRFILENREELRKPAGPLSVFLDKSVRVVFRDTRQYELVLYTLMAPKYQRSGLYKSLLIESLNRGFCREPERPLLWAFVSDEKSSLEGMDVPCFTLPSTAAELTSSNGERVEGYYSQSGIAAVLKRLDGFCEEDLARQRELLAEALSTTLTSRMKADPTLIEVATPDPASGALEAASWIGNEMMRRATRTDEGALRWPQSETTRSQDRIENYDLYEGSAGIAVFLAALGRAKKDASFEDAALEAFQPVENLLDRLDKDSRSEAEPVGVCTGVASIAYSAVLLARLTGRDRFSEIAHRGTEVLSVSRIKGSKCDDVVSGTAGALLALLTAYEHLGENSILDRAVACGKRLVSNRVVSRTGSVAWPAANRVLLAGFAHGTAGIAYALLRLHAHTGERALLNIAARAMQYERELFSPQRCNWPVLSGARGAAASFMTAWCHGAPGIGMARSLALGLADDPEIREEIEAAAHATIRATQSRLDTVCCGNMGRAESLLVTARKLGDAVLEQTARGVADAVLARALERGHFGLPYSSYHYRIFDPGFFQGISGIGYQFLRFAMPDRIPSVMALGG